jgi:DNA polymerase I-like protein with 3'-5' exonuclease and polymerase domains
MRIIFDLEGDGLYYKITQTWCLVYKNIDTKEVTQLIYYEDNFVEKLRDLFQQCSLIIGHNIIGFDLPVLKKLFNIEYTGDVFDTLVASRLLDPDRYGGHSLDAWGKRLKRYKPAHEDWSQFSPEMLHRCTEDVEINDLVYQQLISDMQGHDWSQAFRLEQQVAKIITQQEINGVYFNKQKAEEYVGFLDDKMVELYWKIVPQLGYINDTTKRTCKKPFSKYGGYAQKVKKLLGAWDLEISGPFTYVVPILSERQTIIKKLIALGWEPTEFTDPTERFPEGQAKLTSKGEPVDSLKQWDNSLGKDLALYLTLKQRRSTIKNPVDESKGWLNKLRDDGRIVAGANPLGTPTGRMRQNTVVNVPKANEDENHELIWDIEKQSDIFGTQLRSLFCAPEGKVFVGHDAAGIENRMLAHYIDDKSFTETIINGSSSNGTDLHSVLWKMIDKYVHSRSKTKGIEYAFFYGAQDEKLGSMVDVKPKGWSNKKMGAEIRRLISQGVPNLERLTNRVQTAAKRGYLIGLDGRKMYVRSTHAALNVLLQGAAAAVMKVSMCYLDNWVKKYQLDVMKVIDMHDEAQAEVFPEHTELYAKFAVQSILKAGEYFNLRCPLDAEAKIGMNWAETH